MENKNEEIFDEYAQKPSAATVKSEPKEKALVKVSAEVDEVFNFALQQNADRIFNALRIENASKRALENVQIKIESDPEFFEPFVCGADYIGVNSAAGFKDLPLSCSYTYLAGVTERLNAAVNINVFEGAELIATENKIVKLLPFDFFVGTEAPEILAAFSLPSDPFVTEILSKAAELLREQNLSLDGYTSGPTNVRKQLAAIYSVIQSYKINYALPPVDFEKAGQRVRLPSAISHSHLMTCLDSSLLLCSCAEAAGLNPMVILLPGHAMFGCWLSDKSFPDCVTDEKSKLLLRLAGGVSELMLVESTFLTKVALFEEAASEAETALKTKNFICCIDIKRARSSAIFPLPLEFCDNSYRPDRRKIEEAGLQESKEVLEIKVDTARRESKGGRFEKWQRELLDTSLSNPLISYRPERMGVPLIISSSEDIEDVLSEDEQLQLAARPKEMPGNDFNPLNMAGGDALEKFVKDGFSAGRAYSFLDEGALNKKLTEMYRSAKNSREETGASTLYLALGFLKWYEKDSIKGGKDDKERYAPIVLFPVELMRKSVKSGYYIKMRDDEAQVNLSLVEHLRASFDIDASALNSLPRGEHGLDLKKIFTFIRRLIIELKGWDVVEAASLGIFNYSKFVMYNDLVCRADKIKNHPLVKSLIENRTAPELAGEIPTAAEEKIYTPLPADFNQYSAVADAAKGKSFVLHGPPGTGKSQTITNIIANALAQGKRVLFVAEKAAALDVVKRRLDSLNLSDFCLEMHSNKMSKANILSQFAPVNQIRENALDVQYASAEEKYKVAANVLDDFASAMHRPQKFGDSAYGALEKRAAAAEFKEYPAERWDIKKEEFDADIRRLEKIKELSKPFGEPKFSAFYILSNPLYSNALRDNVLAAAKQMAAVAPAARQAAEKLNDAFGGDESIEDFAHNDIYRFINYVRYNLKRIGTGKFGGALRTVFSRRYRMYKKNPLTANAKEYAVNSGAEYKSALEALDKFVTADAVFKKALGAVKDKNNKLYAFSDYLSGTGRAANRIISQIGSMKEYCLFLSELNAARAAGLPGAVLDAYFDGEISGAELAGTYKRSFFGAAAKGVIDSDEQLKTFVPTDFSNKIREFCAYSDFVGELAAKEIYKLAAERVPMYTQTFAASGEPGILSKAVQSGGRDISVRKLFERTANLLALIKPVMLMSPLSAAQYLSEGFPDFDIVIYDEASQLLTAETVGTLSRAKSAVIVGDPNQLPPTTFFKTDSNAAAEDFETVDLDSFLDDVLAVNLPQRYLKWHYRSTHESLITFSNINYYDGRLVTFPSSDDTVSKVKLKLITGEYDRGGSRTNKGEANAIADDLFVRLKMEGDKKSFGIIAFSAPQAQLIEDVVDARLKKEPEMEKYFDREHEPVFIKNIENVQGDERDVILFSVCYAPDAEGKMTANFGPLNKSGGWRRLNVALTRSKYEMVVYSCMDSGRIRLSAASSAGATGLKEFLAYAGNDKHYNISGGADTKPDALIAELCEKLRKAGLNVRANVGKSANKVDIAVIGAGGEYRLGVLMDTRSYGETSYTRDREYAKEAMLRRLGWNITRIYALEYYEDAERTVRKIISAAENGAESFPISMMKKKLESEHGEAVSAAVSELIAPQIPYERAEIEGGSTTEFYDPAADKKIIAALKEIVAAEAPVAKKILFKRIAAAWGVRLGDKFTERIAPLFKACKFFVNRTMETEFVFAERKDAANLTHYRENSEEKRESENICKEEFSAAMLFIVRSCITADEDDIIRETARQFGFIKSPALWTRLGFAVNKLIDDGLIEYDENRRLRAREN